MSNEKSIEPVHSGTVANAIVTAGIGALADLAGAHGDPASAVALKGIAPMIGYSAERGWVWAGRQAGRISEFVQQLGGKAEAAGIGDRLKDVADLIEQAVPVIGATASGDKRRIIEEIIVNAARSREPLAREAEALRAIALVDAMEPEDAIIFGCTYPAHSGLTVGDLHHLSGLPIAFVFDSVSRLLQLGLVEDEINLSYITRDKDVAQDFSLTFLGIWLQEWVGNHPSNTTTTTDTNGE